MINSESMQVRLVIQKNEIGCIVFNNDELKAKFAYVKSDNAAE